MNLKSKKRFSTYLMTAIVVLVTGSVLLISGVLYIYFGKRLDSEFIHKVQAQKGQIEILLKNRIASVQSKLMDLSSDNTIRFTMMMGKPSQLEEQLKQSYPVKGSVYFYAQKRGEQSMVPESYPGVSPEMIDRFKSAHGDILEDGETLRLIWWFEAPVMNKKEHMGKVYAFYDMTRDTELIKTISQTVNGDVSLAKTDNLLSLIHGTSLPFDKKVMQEISTKRNLHHLDSNFVLSTLDGFKNLYFISSQENLLIEKRRISFFIGVFSILVLSFSAVLSLVLARQMGGPLSDMANKAIQISEGKKDLTFNDSGEDYWEFHQLSQAFNHMLINLKEAEERSRYNELLENVDDAVYLVDESGKILEANEATYLQLGYSPETFFHLDLSAVLPKEDAKMLLDQINNNHNSDSSDKTTFETFHVSSGGDFIPVEINFRPITYRGSKAILNVARDIRERQEAEKALRESEERYRSVVENSHDGILIIDDHFQLIYVNNELCEMLGYARHEIEGKDFREFLMDEDISPLKEHYLRGLEGEKGKLHYELKLARKDGSIRYGKISATVIKDSIGKMSTVVHILDITDQFMAEREKNQLESQLRQAQKMEAVGTLAGGVAHDFNNLLCIIQGYSDMLLREKNKDEPNYRELQEIKHATHRASELTQQLLTFSRRVESSMMPVCLNYEIKQVYTLLKRTIPKMIEIELNLAGNLKTINADPAQLGQVLMNLGVNARDAMPEGGRLYIQTENSTLDEEYCKTHLEVTPGDYVLVTISDTGNGMDKETIEHIFEPFYTTKEVGQGTGLGLAIVYGIVKNHDGHIICYSELGVGTTFQIYLPVIEQETSLKETEDEETTVGGTETIFLVDDDERVRNLGYDILSKSGYNVLTAQDGESALEYFSKKRGDIDLFIIDLIMPGIGGKKLLEELLKLKPDVKVVMASGYSPLGSASAAVSAGAKSFVSKPYKSSYLLRVVREVLDEI
ncbi:MAG: PAS domain S-box protein [Thermodesulfobacteriota bacterium]|nr:PAS domain S-box protein [Thermodesulfobacteriota bacterium]